MRKGVRVGGALELDDRLFIRKGLRRYVHAGDQRYERQQPRQSHERCHGLASSQQPGTASTNARLVLRTAAAIAPGCPRGLARSPITTSPAPSALAHCEISS